MGRRSRKPYRRWSKDAVVAELKRLDRVGQRMTANALVDAGHTGLASAIHKYVGSFDRARRLARIPSPGRLSPDSREHWDEDRVVDEIRIRHRDGESLAYKQVPTKLIDAALYYCDSWKNAIEMAGLDYSSVRRSNAPWSRAEIVEALREAAASNRKGVGRDGAIPVDVSLAARRTFGSVRAALVVARLKPEQVFRRTRLDDRELATALRKLVRERPKMSRGDIRRAPLGRVLARRFGSVERGLVRLGIRWRPAPRRRARSRT
jgi:hypothetical protein